MTILTKTIRRTAFLFALPFLIWSGYWAASAQAITKGVSLASEDTQFLGLSAQFEMASVTGYPQRFTVGLSDIEIETENIFIWKTQGVSLEAKSYLPNKITLELSEPHRISGSLGELDIDAAHAEITALFQPNWRLALGNISLSFNDLKIASANQWGASIGTVLASVKSFPDNSNAYQLSAELKNLNLSDVIVGVPAKYQTIQNLSLLSEILLTRPLDRLIIGNGAPTLQRLLLQKAQFDFGASLISVDGKLDFEENGVMTGNVNVTVQDWKSLFNLAKDVGYIEPNLEDFFAMILADLAAQEGSDDTLTIPLNIQNNKISYGALNLGILP